MLCLLCYYFEVQIAVELGGQCCGQSSSGCSSSVGMSSSTSVSRTASNNNKSLLLPNKGEMGGAGSVGSSTAHLSNTSDSGLTAGPTVAAAAAPSMMTLQQQSLTEWNPSMEIQRSRSLSHLVVQQQQQPPQQITSTQLRTQQCTEPPKSLADSSCPMVASITSAEDVGIEKIVEEAAPCTATADEMALEGVDPDADRHTLELAKQAVGGHSGEDQRKPLIADWQLDFRPTNSDVYFATEWSTMTCHPHWLVFVGDDQVEGQQSDSPAEEQFPTRFQQLGQSEIGVQPQQRKKFICIGDQLSPELFANDRQREKNPPPLRESSSDTFRTVTSAHPFGSGLGGSSKSVDKFRQKYSWIGKVILLHTTAATNPEPPLQLKNVKLGGNSTQSSPIIGYPPVT